MAFCNLWLFFEIWSIYISRGLDFMGVCKYDTPPSYNSFVPYYEGSPLNYLIHVHTSDITLLLSIPFTHMMIK